MKKLKITADKILNCKAPAKLNLFLHIVGRNNDGYHQLQTALQLIDLHDYLDFYVRNDNNVTRLDAASTLLATELPKNDLSVKAAHLLQKYTNCSLGVDIILEKHIPIGAGLGGGSSDAAITLLALNKLWRLFLPMKTLMDLGLQLGADVPFFLFGTNAFAQGIGERLTVIPATSKSKFWFVMLTPFVEVNTKDAFSHPGLTRNTKPVRIANFLSAEDEDTIELLSMIGKNDLQITVAQKYSKVNFALQWLLEQTAGNANKIFGSAKMSGSGSSVFVTFICEAAARKLAEKAIKFSNDADVLNGIRNCWATKCVSALDVHPMLDLLYTNQ